MLRGLRDKPASTASAKSLDTLALSSRNSARREVDRGRA
jgi:hypothetical protein